MHHVSVDLVEDGAEHVAAYQHEEEDYYPHEYVFVVLGVEFGLEAFVDGLDVLKFSFNV